MTTKCGKLGLFCLHFARGISHQGLKAQSFNAPAPHFLQLNHLNHFFSWLKPNFCWFNPHFFGITSAGGQVSGFDVRSSIARRVAGAWRHGFLLIFPGNPGFWGITFPSSNQSMICLGRYDLFSGASAKPRL